MTAFEVEDLDLVTARGSQKPAARLHHHLHPRDGGDAQSETSKTREPV
jgi:hypothetical protein